MRAGWTLSAEEIARDEFAWDTALEDVHMNIEKRLTDRIGDAGKRLHTGRSRNDQVATDIRLYTRAAIERILGESSACKPLSLPSPSVKQRPSCPASPICKSRNPLPSAIT